ncbi:MAG TPA: glycosyltransferase family 2 protein [Candidatus Wunengus sp. YC63]|uniref:glycosyltransferase family 2 protein n=1 Tax=unclassified Candidatus Wunengus TaxID=3367695 RepID=UPI00402A53FA
MRKVIIKNSIAHSTPLPRVLITIVNWNGRDDLIELLASIKNLTYPKDNYKIMVIDNGSSDGSQTAISQSLPDVYLLENKRNIGYVKAVNQGIANGLNMAVDYIWIFNNDVTVEEDSLKKLVEVGQQDENIGIIAPVIYSYKNPEVIENIGYQINFWIGKLKKLTFGRDVFQNDHDTYAEVDSQLGCSTLIKSTVFKMVGNFQAIYNLYFEETDFNVRARKKGFRVVIAKDAKVWHKTASTMNKFILRRAYLLLRNLFLFELLNAQLKHLLVFIPYYFVIHLPYFLFYGSIYGLKIKFKKGIE